LGSFGAGYLVRKTGFKGETGGFIAINLLASYWNVDINSSLEHCVLNANEALNKLMVESGITINKTF
jgi:hypothetical protein